MLINKGLLNTTIGVEFIFYTALMTKNTATRSNGQKEQKNIILFHWDGIIVANSTKYFTDNH